MSLRGISWIWDTTSGDFNYSNAVKMKSDQGVQKAEGNDNQNYRTLDTTTYKWYALTRAAALAAAANADSISNKETLTTVTLENMIVGSYTLKAQINLSSRWRHG